MRLLVLVLIFFCSCNSVTKPFYMYKITVNTSWKTAIYYSENKPETEFDGTRIKVTYDDNIIFVHEGANVSIERIRK